MCTGIRKVAVVARAAAALPRRSRSPAPASTVLKSGEPLLLANIDDEFLRGDAVDERHAELIRRLGTRSAVVVPLVARDTTLGALTLSSASPGRFGRPTLSWRPNWVAARPWRRQRSPPTRDAAGGTAA